MYEEESESISVTRTWYNKANKHKNNSSTYDNESK